MNSSCMRVVLYFMFHNLINAEHDWHMFTKWRSDWKRLICLFLYYLFFFHLCVFVYLQKHDSWMFSFFPLDIFVTNSCAIYTTSSCTWKYWPFPPIILHRTLYNIWQYTFPLIPPLFCLPLHILLSSFSPLFDSLFLKVLYRKSVSTLSLYEQYTVCPWCIVENQISGFVG